MEELLKQVANLLAERAPGVYASFNPPATWAEIAEAQYKSDLTFSDDLMALFRWCNGQRDGDLGRTALLSTAFPRVRLGNLDWVVTIARYHHDMLDAKQSEEPDDAWKPGPPDGDPGRADRVVDFHRGLLPVGRSDDGLCSSWMLDLLPAPAGRVGQVLQLGTEGMPHCRRAWSLRAMFERMHNALSREALVWDAKTGWRCGDENTPWFMAGTEEPPRAPVLEDAFPRKAEVWDDIPGRLGSLGLQDSARLQAAADPDEHLLAALTSMHAVLPPEVAEAYCQHDGQAPDAGVPLLLGRYRWLPVQEMARAWRALQHRARKDAALQAHADFEHSAWREADVRPCAHSANWLPIGQDPQGHWLMLDLMPGPRGVRGQLIEACRDADSRTRWCRVVAGGLDEAVVRGLAALRADRPRRESLPIL